jgi:lysozyme family protein
MSGGRFDVCVAKTLGHEGGFSDHKADKGGKTNLGITLATLNQAKALGIVPFRITIQDLTVAQAKSIYFRLYWLPARCAQFPAPLDLLLFDAQVNHRPKVAARLIQSAVEADRDGAIGPDTIAKADAIAKSADQDAMPKAIERYAEARKDFFRQIVSNDPSQKVFLRGWLNRVDRVTAQAQAEITTSCDHSTEPRT